MHIILLKFAENKAQAPDHMAAHNAWLKQGFDEGIFMLAGSLQPGIGGGLIAKGMERDALEAFIEQDPFVAHHVVRPEIMDFTPAKADDRLAFLMN